MGSSLALRDLSSQRIPPGNSNIDSDAQFSHSADDASIHTTTNITSTTELRPITKSRQIIVLISAFLTICVTIGFNQSYGVFQSYYMSAEQTMLPPDTRSSPALVAFIGTLGYGLTWAGSIFINPLMARLAARNNSHNVYSTNNDSSDNSPSAPQPSPSSPRRTLSRFLATTPATRLLSTIGVLLISLAFLLASLSHTVPQLLLTQGILYGTGASLLYFPILSSAPEYFTTHRGTAMGIILSGAGIGGLVFAPTVRALLSALGPRWTLRILALLNLVVSLPIAVTAAPSRFVGDRPTHVDLRLALKPAFLFSVGAGFLQAGGNGLPVTFLVEYSVVLGYSPGFGASLLAVMNAVNSVSRVATGWAGDRFGRQNALIVTVVLSMVAVAGFWLGSIGSLGSIEDGSGNGSRSRGLWIAFVIIYGAAGGGYNALFPTTISDVFGLQAYASVAGFLYFIRGLGTVFGSPVGGKILGADGSASNYAKLVYFDAALLAGASVCVVGVRVWDAVGKREWVWRA